MAIGAALLFNIHLPQNFNSPYKATGMIDFWKRWHITLTNFITTYIYTPIIRSFSPLTFHKAMLGTLITFLIAGLWHGASWMFIIFGGLHGLGIVINQYWKKRKIKLHKVVAWLITFNFINVTFVFFRAENWEGAMHVLNGMISIHSIQTPDNIQVFIYPIIAFALLLLTKNTHQLMGQFKASKKIGYLTFACFALSLLQLNNLMISSNHSEFLYFNF